MRHVDERGQSSASARRPLIIQFRWWRVRDERLASLVGRADDRRRRVEHPSGGLAGAPPPRRRPLWTARLARPRPHPVCRRLHRFVTPLVVAVAPPEGAKNNQVVAFVQSVRPSRHFSLPAAAAGDTLPRLAAAAGFRPRPRAGGEFVRQHEKRTPNRSRNGPPIWSREPNFSAASLRATRRLPD